MIEVKYKFEETFDIISAFKITQPLCLFSPEIHCIKITDLTIIKNS